MSLDQVKAIADGRVFSATEAKRLGLIDGIGSLESVIYKAIPTRGKKKMTQKEQSAASYQQLVEECVGADPEFICSQLERSATVDEARKDWMVEQQLRADELKSQNDKLQSKQTAEKKKPGVEPLLEESIADSGNGDAVEQFNAKVDALVASGMKRQKAVSIVVRKNPDLHKQMLIESNHGRKKALASLAERFE